MTSLFIKLRFRHSHVLALVGLTLGVAALPASAQYSPSATLDLGIGYGQIAIGQSVLSGTRAKGGTKKQGRAKSTRPAPVKRKAPVTPVDPMVLRWDDALSADYRDDFLDMVGDDQREELNAMLNGLEPTKTFRKLAYGYGLSPFSVPDLITTYAASHWEIVTGRKAARAKIAQLSQGIRADMKQSSALIKALREATPQKKQGWMEEQAYEVALGRLTYAKLKKNNDARKLKEFRADLVSSARLRGIAIGNLKLA